MLAFLLLDGLSDFLLIDSLHVQVGVRCANQFEVIGLLQPLSSPVCMLGGIDIGVRIEHARRPRLGWRSTEGTTRLAWVHWWLVLVLWVESLHLDSISGDDLLIPDKGQGVRCAVHFNEVSYDTLKFHPKALAEHHQGIWINFGLVRVNSLS